MQLINNDLLDVDTTTDATTMNTGIAQDELERIEGYKQTRKEKQKAYKRIYRERNRDKSRRQDRERYYKKKGLPVPEVSTRGGHNVVDALGQRFGRLLVLKQGPSKKYAQGKAATWLCRCDCGNELFVSGHSLRGGNTKSCGCLAKEIHKKPKGEASFHAIIISMRNQARRRDLDWCLTDEQVRSLITQECHYCGAPPAQGCRSPTRNGAFVYNGLDRVDNTKGYTIDNVVPCCIGCNRAKSTMTIEEFRALIKNIYVRLNLGEN